MFSYKNHKALDRPSKKLKMEALDPISSYFTIYRQNEQIDANTEFDMENKGNLVNSFSKTIDHICPVIYNFRPVSNKIEVFCRKTMKVLEVRKLNFMEFQSKSEINNWETHKNSTKFVKDQRCIKRANKIKELSFQWFKSKTKDFKFTSLNSDLLIINYDGIRVQPFIMANRPRLLNPKFPENSFVEIYDLPHLPKSALKLLLIYVSKLFV